MESSSLHNDPSLFPTKQIKFSGRKTHRQNHNHKHHHQAAAAAARLPNISRQSSCGGRIVQPPYVQLDMVHATTGSVFLNHFLSNNNNQFPISSSSLPPILPSHHHYNHHQQPPLLPLPTFHSLPVLTHRSSLSSPIPKKPTNQKVVTTTNNKRSTTKNMKNKKENRSQGVGPDPVSDPKDVTRVKNDDMIIAPSVFCVSPPPSSLPLPKFFLRQGCKAQAAVDEVDAGAATDNLCRFLKLQ